MKRTPLFFVIAFTLFALAIMPSARMEVNPTFSPALKNAPLTTFAAAPVPPPTVTLTSPFNNAQFVAGATIRLSANAADSDGTVSKVEFYQGAVKLATITSSPYNYDWTDVPAGNYVLTAVATDNQSQATTSSAVNVAVLAQAKQYVSWSSIANGTDLGNGSVRKTSTGAWDFTANALQTLLPGDGFFESTAASFNQSISLTGANGQNRAIVVGSGSWVGIYEGSTEVASTFGHIPSETITPHIAGDRYRIEITNSVLRYIRYRGAVREVMFQSTAPMPTYPMTGSLGMSPQNAEWQKTVLAQLTRKATWTSIVNGIDLGNGTVRKTSTGNWDFSASAGQILARGDGYFESTASYWNHSMNVSGSDGAARSLVIGTGGWAAIYENGTEVANTSPLANISPHGAGDRYRLEISNGTLRYVRFRGGIRSIVYTSANPLPAYPLSFSLGMGIQNSEWQNTVFAQLSNTVTWTSIVNGIDLGNGSVRKTSTGTWDFTASARQQLVFSPGYFESTASYWNHSINVSGSDAQGRGLLAGTGGWAAVYENNVEVASTSPLGNLSPHTAGDRYRLELSRGKLRYVRYRNGVRSLAYTSTNPVPAPAMGFSVSMSFQNTEWQITQFSDNVPEHNDAAFVSQTVPTTMTPGQTYNVSVTMRNTGASTWTPDGDYQLGAENLSDNTRWGMSRVNLTSIVPPGSDATFNFTVTAPAAGSHSFQWRMVQQDVQRFGALTTNVNVQTVNNPPAVTLTSPTEGATFTAPATVPFAATASDSDGTITKVEFFQGSVKVGEDTTTPYNFSWTSVSAGTYVLSAKATDSGGATVMSNTANITVNPPNQLPAVSLTAPTNGQVFSAPANITLTASASDADGMVTKVQFFQGTTLIGEDTSAPFSFPWNNVAAGSYSLTAKAFDNAGATTTSAAVSIIVNALPTVSITSPTHPTTFTAPANFTINASASDPDGSIVKVEFFAGVSLLGEDTTAPYSWPMNNVAQGVYSLTAKATDNRGGTTTSSLVSVVVNTLPSVSITSPAHPTTFVAPASFTISATASDPDGSITKVEFFAGVALLGTDTTAPYTLPMNNLTHGVYSLTAKATDNNGGTRTSSLVSAVVTDPPTTSISGPVNNTTILAGSNIIISANASDDGSIAKVEFFRNGILLGQDTTAPYNFAWNSVPEGTYSLTTRATDDLGVTATSAPVTLNAVSSGLVSRLDPRNKTGGGTENPLSRNYNWSVPLISLSGRAEMELGLSLSYNSLVWTRTGTFVTFDDDAGFPSPGFRLGFPTIQGQFFNSEASKNAYLLILTDGSRTELRQVGTSTLYQSVDSTHLLLDSTTMVLRTPNGMAFSYVQYGSNFQCVEIKDRNGNFVTINRDGAGRITTIVDTLGRTITFNYDPTEGTLTTITQSWGGTSHVWASFNYINTTVQTGFINVTKFGPANGATVKTLRTVWLNDNSRFEFDYTSWIQISRINHYATDGHLLNYRTYNLPASGSTQLDDCPRFTERRDWAENFNRGGAAGASGLPSGPEEELLSGIWTVPASASWTLPDGTNESGVMVQMTHADGTFEKIYFAGTAGTSTGWRRGLSSMIETFGKTTPDQPSAIKQRTGVSTWTQDDENVSFMSNPRVRESHVYDFDGSGQIKNHKRTRTTFVSLNLGDGTSCSLPQDIFEYEANATTVLRRTHTDYHTLSSAYTSRRVIGLPSESRMYEVDPSSGAETLMTRNAFAYDEAGSIQGTDAPIQHDNTNYTASFVVGRGNLSSVTRYNVVTGASTVTRAKYDTAGSPRKTIDALGHEVNIGYADSFSDGINRNTLAYATSVTDGDGFTATSQYNFDHGLITRSQTPPPAGHAVGPIKKFTYDAKTRLEKVAIEINGNPDYSHTRFIYPDSQNRVDTYTTIETGQGEALAFKLFDGHGRAIAMASAHPGSSGGFAAKLMLFDKLGRTIKESNPTETNTSGSYLQWAATGDDSPANGGSGWIYTNQSYDWNSRPLTLTNPDGTTKAASYEGCGCAGGDTVTFTNEGTAADGTTKRRQQKIYRDVLGRIMKTETYNWDGTGPNGTNGTIYSTTVNTYNARDQITRARKFQGSPADPNAGSCLSETLRFGTDNTWKQTQTFSSGWQNTGFDDSSWSNSVDEGGATTSPWGAGGFQSNTPAHWIWYYDSRLSGDTSTVYFRKGFIATSNAATLTIRGDNIYTAYLNGVQVATGTQWQLTNTVNLTLTPGSTYVLAIEVANQGGPGGLIAEVNSIGTSCEQGLMTYDGYGRLKTRHVPGQDLNGATTYNYSDDDAVTSIVDARGATTTYSVNNRHLVTGISYDVPFGSGITDPANVTYAYDAASNRTSMTDGLGSMSYQYDQLSRVSKETRNFADPASPFLSASYELNYQYNLANQPKKITDHTNSTINYNYDQSGRISAVTGENNLYAGVATYASLATYRAWNALKGVTYGNNYTTAVKYNSRLQGTEFEVAGRPSQFGPSTVMKTTYDYYGDASLKFANDTLDERFDRAYSYDNVGRLKEAYTGSEARDYRDGTNSGAATGPYRQSYQYDVYDHITQRSNRFWSQFDSFNASYANNRRQDPAFQYDAEGNLTRDSDLHYTYDAANRSITTFNFVGSGGRSSTLSYDGDGHQLKKSVTQSSITTVTYYVRSSVLGGRVVTELNGQGIKQKGFVYAGAQEIARQENNAVVWQHVNPLTGSSGDSFANGSYVITNEPDPMGVNVGTEDPFAGLPFTGFEPTPERPMIFSLGDDGGGCSFSNPNCTTCTLDGFSIGCDRAMHLVDIGAADIVVTLSNGSRVPVSAPGGCPLGVCRIWVPAQDLDLPHPEDDGDVVRIFTDETQGFWYTFSFPFAPQGQGPAGPQGPQNPQPTGTPSTTLPGCVFEIDLKDNGLLKPDQLKALKDEITRIFKEAGQEIRFGNSNPAYKLEVNDKGANYTTKQNAVGTTPKTGTYVHNNGRVFVDRLTASAKSTTDGDTKFGQNSKAVAIGLGRAGSHEIAHFLLQQDTDGPGFTGVMHDGFKGTEWFTNNTERLWKFTDQQIKQLNSLCGR